ncbi:glycoside hydrolase family 28 protein [Euzebyella saccharophila]|uniref:Glycoside hydrolase family 28 protein n=1 Tax=Euzebyella saccharophila TaxID=679664 RepID=A0ABV8JVV9_9FLAO|nr:glycoside hydrolase family 28 protein [Euzebyella saccharophila]
MTLLKKVYLIALISLLSFSCKKEKAQLAIIEQNVEAPFEMPPIKSPDFSNCPTISIVDKGAEKGNQQATEQAIQAAIIEANASGCGTVVIPKGEWLTGKLHLKSNVNLHLEEGAILLFSDNPKDYLPAVHTTWEGMECYNYSPLIYAYECENVAITGKGELRAKMGTWEKWFGRPPGHMNSLKRLYNLAAKSDNVEERQMVNDSANLRPHFIQFNRSKNILMEDITITNSPFWVIHPYLSNDVTIRRVKVTAHGHNNDGVDPEMSQNVLIEDCVFDQGDDAIAVKSGRNQDAWRLNTPSKNMVIRNCTVKNGHQLLAVGSELSGGIENILIDNCIVEDEASLFHLLFIKTNERRGGYVKNIFMNNIKANEVRNGVLGIETDVLYQWRDLVPTYEKRLTPISDINLKNVQLKKGEFISKIMGQEEEPVKNISLINVQVDSLLGEEQIHENVIGFKIE